MKTKFVKLGTKSFTSYGWLYWK